MSTMLDHATYTYGSHQFEVPKNSRKIEFNRGDKVRSVEILISLEDELYGIKIAPEKFNGTAEEACKAAFKSASPLFVDEDMPPTQVGIAWRCKKRLQDGAQAPLVLDMAFVEDNGSVIRLSIACDHTKYPDVKPIFDHAIETLRLV